MHQKKKIALEIAANIASVNGPLLRRRPTSSTSCAWGLYPVRTNISVVTSLVIDSSRLESLFSGQVGISEGTCQKTSEKLQRANVMLYTVIPDTFNKHKISVIYKCERKQKYIFLNVKHV